MSFRTTVLDLTAIDSGDDTYRITTSPDWEDLAESIQHVGLINPPVLLEKQDGYITVAGFRRVAAMRQLNHRQIPTRVMPGESLPIERVRIAVSDNTSQRRLDLLETSRALALLSGCVKDRESFLTEARILGLPDNHQHIEKILGIFRLPQLIQDGIFGNRISLSMADELLELDASAGELLARLFVELKLNQNKQREICSHLKEISHREKCPSHEVLLSEGISEILADKELDNLQKTRIVRTKLRRRRFPNLALAEETFQDNLRKLHLSSQISLLPSDYFEGTSLSLSMSFKNETEFKERIDMLNRTLANPHLKKLFQSY